MLAAIFALVVGLIVGIFIAGTGRQGKEYDAETAEWFFKEQEKKIAAEHESLNRWRLLAVRQQEEIRALTCADDLYPKQPDKVSRLASLLFELMYEESGFTRILTPSAKARLIEGCKRLLPDHTREFIDWLARFDWNTTGNLSDDLVIYEQNEQRETVAEIMVRAGEELVSEAA